MPDLDMRTVSVLVAFYAFTFGLGLLFFHYEQRRYRGVRFVALSHLCMSIGVGLMALREFVPAWLSIITGNMVLCAGVTLALFGFAQYRESSQKLFKVSLCGLPLLLLVMIYFCYVYASVNARVIAVSLQLGMTQMFTAMVIYQGRASDTKLPKNTLILAYALVSLIMFLRALFVMFEGEITQYMQTGWLYQSPYFATMFLIMVMSFNLVWMVNGRLTRSVEALSIRDNLTSLYNRRGMDRIASPLAISTSEQQQPLVAIMCDIDRFKSINDRFGHIVGDDVIISVSEQIRRQLRTHDVAIRYGGEEFLIILPNTQIDDAAIVAERIRLAVYNMPPLGVDMPLISVSLGVAKQQGKDLDSLIKACDFAMYQAKRQGRNRVVIATDAIQEIRKKSA